jgi:hypothetical protein
MLGTGSALMAALGLLLMGALPAELMLCVHSDGHVEVEIFQELCCESSCPDDLPAECPDDQCRDVPLTMAFQAVPGSPPALPDLAPSADLSPIEPPSPAFALRASEPLSGDLDPPRSPPLDFLRSVVLRH